MKQTDFEALCRDVFPFWQELSEQEKESLYRDSALMQYPGGSTLHDGSECSGVFLVRKGMLRVSILSEEGKEITLYRLHPGEVCMLSASCVLQAITFDVLVNAEEDCECCVISGASFAALAERLPSVKIFSQEMAIIRFSDVMWVMQQILFLSLDKRLAIFLLDESLRLNSLTICLTHDQIARYMGSAREVVSRMLKYFAEEGLVALSRGKIRVLDKTRLRRLAL